MQLVADRFAVLEDGRAIDLATAAPVTLIITTAGGVSDQLRWTQRCSTFRLLRHRSVATLIDFGLAGESSRFEAWACGSTRCVDLDAVAVHARATRWLHACGMSTGALGVDAIGVAADGRRVWIPDPGTGYPEADVPEGADLQIAECGLRIIDRPAIAALAEMFDADIDARPQVSTIWGPAGSGKRTIVGELARTARMRGFVPVTAGLIGSRHSDLWRGRSLFVIADCADDPASHALLDAALATPAHHVLMMVGEQECRSIDGLPALRLPADALSSAIRPRPANVRLEQVIQRAAARARGLPGRFIQLLWPEWNAMRASERRRRKPNLSRVAEQAIVYGAAPAVETVFDPPVVACAWPAPGELVTLRRKMEHALAEIRNGHHAPGMRVLRQVIGSLARRGAWDEAAGGTLVLAGSLLRRGRTRHAQAAIEDGRNYARRGGLNAMLIDFAVLAGHAWTDLARLDEADSVLGAALVTAREHRDPERIASVAVALARGSYWRGNYADAETALAAAASVETARIRRSLLRARIATGLGDFNTALSLLSRASEEVRSQDLSDRGAIVAVTAFVHLAVGDLTASARDLSDALTLARGARDSQLAIRARLLRAELERASGRPAKSLSELLGLRRLVTTAPPILRIRWELAKALVAHGGAGFDAAATDLVTKHIQRTGLGALVLYVRARQGDAAQVGDADVSVSWGGAADPLAGELVAILRVCQTAADEVEQLKKVCGHLRQHLHAAAVGFVNVCGDRVDTITCDGAALDGSIARRAVTAGITIGAHRVGDRIEAAAPIEYGGSFVGALCARWTIGSTYETSRASSVLTMSAVAAAPMVAAVGARQAQPQAAAGELVGITPVMSALRQSVERAAAAPFAVLVDGESGCGKELVARAIHRGSTRRHKAFCTLNCAALPDDLVEAELFGHTRGAFTGAVADRAGVFEEAHGGTLFLDEIGELTPRAQAKVLRVIQEGELRRVGENISRRVDVRFVAATNRDLKQEVDAGRFRLDLLYRLDVLHLTVPPLRERREDIALLAFHFWRDAAQRVGSQATLGAAVVAALARYDWPGNVRELQNVLAALAVRTAKRGVVPATALPPCFGESAPGESWSLDQARRTFELRFVRAALVRAGGHRGRTAAELGVTRQGLTKLMNRLGIAP